jgi:hypothetical protein
MLSEPDKDEPAFIWEEAFWVGHTDDSIERTQEPNSVH